jgi:hypothetical protein
LGTTLTRFPLRRVVCNFSFVSYVGVFSSRGGIPTHSRHFGAFRVLARDVFLCLTAEEKKKALKSLRDAILSGWLVLSDDCLWQATYRVLNFAGLSLHFEHFVFFAVFFSWKGEPKQREVIVDSKSIHAANENRREMDATNVKSKAKQTADKKAAQQQKQRDEERAKQPRNRSRSSSTDGAPDTKRGKAKIEEESATAFAMPDSVFDNSDRMEIEESDDIIASRNAGGVDTERSNNSNNNGNNNNNNDSDTNASNNNRSNNRNNEFHDKDNHDNDDHGDNEGKEQQAENAEIAVLQNSLQKIAQQQATKYVEPEYIVIAGDSQDAEIKAKKAQFPQEARERYERDMLLLLQRQQQLQQQLERLQQRQRLKSETTRVNVARRQLKEAGPRAAEAVKLVGLILEQPSSANEHLVKHIEKESNAVMTSVIIGARLNMTRSELNDAVTLHVSTFNKAIEPQSEQAQLTWGVGRTGITEHLQFVRTASSHYTVEDGMQKEFFIDNKPVFTITRTRFAIHDCIAFHLSKEQVTDIMAATDENETPIAVIHRIYFNSIAYPVIALQLVDVRSQDKGALLIFGAPGLAMTNIIKCAMSHRIQLAHCDPLFETTGILALYNAPNEVIGTRDLTPAKRLSKANTTIRGWSKYLIEQNVYPKFAKEIEDNNIKLETWTPIIAIRVSTEPTTKATLVEYACVTKAARALVYVVLKDHGKTFEGVGFNPSFSVAQDYGKK